MEVVRSKLTSGQLPDFDLIRLRQEFDIRSEQTMSLLESAAVGLSARGLAHELRTHLTEIRQRTSVIEKLAKKSDNRTEAIIPNLRSIRASCSGGNRMALRLGLQEVRFDAEQGIIAKKAKALGQVRLKQNGRCALW